MQRPDLGTLATVFALYTLTPAAWATNGSNIIGASPAGSAMGGTGVASPQSPVEVLHKNPALLGELSGLETGTTAVEFSLNVLKVNTSATYSILPNAAPPSTGAGSKDNGLSRIIPQVGAAYRLQDNVAVGLGFVSYAGTMSDYTGDGLIQQQKTNVSISKFTPSAAYRVTDTLAFGLTPIIGVGQFALNETLSQGTAGGSAAQSSRAPHADLGLSFQLGATYKPLPELRLGLTYLHKTKYEFSNLVDFEPFGGAAQNGLDALVLEQPAEVALGVEWQAASDLTVAADYRFIAWREADSFREFGWKNQSVIAVGAQYKATDVLKLRLGANYNTDALESLLGQNGAATTSLQGKNLFHQSISSLNVFSFPAVTSWHATLGLGYALLPELDLDAAFVYAFKKDFVRAGSTPVAGLNYHYANAISQWLLGVGATWRL